MTASIYLKKSEISKSIEIVQINSFNGIEKPPCGHFQIPRYTAQAEPPVHPLSHPRLEWGLPLYSMAAHASGENVHPTNVAVVTETAVISLAITIIPNSIATTALDTQKQTCVPACTHSYADTYTIIKVA
jgi:hypothetical protein